MQSKIYTLIIYIVTTTLIFAESKLDTVPQTQSIGHAKTSWDDFEGASPTTNIPVIELPKATSTGDAQLAFPIKMPEARKDFMPEINLQYANEGGTSWLGTGWDLSLSSFTLDTRWGVPLYDGTFETEIYLFNGQQLGPVFHREIQYERESEREFHPRQEMEFEKIIRHGDSPRNYWWEVSKKNGSVTYYGGTPNQGIQDAFVLKTDDGNITEWFIVESHDIFGNYINFRYQTKSFLGSTSKMPSQINYNGFKGDEGDYAVKFILKDRTGTNARKDASINYRTGRGYVVADLLEWIQVTYKDEVIRSYELEYETGEFEKQLLTKVSEYDSDDVLFYSYEFDYHNNIRNADNSLSLFNGSESWSLQKDAIDLTTVAGVLPFAEKPTVLGGAKSWTAGAGLAVTVGIAGSPVSKENTVGVNGGGSTTNGTGLTTLIDINGDGLPDKVWKENGKLYFRENLSGMMNSSGSVKGFSSQAKEIFGINDFSKSNTLSGNVGGELNLGVGAVGGFIGYSREFGTTTISTYFADFNGDELIDVASNKTIYFNTIDASGNPRFTTQSSETENPIVGPAPNDPTNNNSAQAQAEIEDQFPLTDVVRVWKAPVSGVVEIEGNVTLIEACDADPTAAANKDGVTVMIQRASTELWRTTIDADDFAPKTPANVNSISVSKSDSIFFRVHSNYNGYCDKVTWDPIIRYTDKNVDQVNADCLSHYEYQASKDYLLTSEGQSILPVDGTVKLTGALNKSCLSDSIRIEIRGGLSWDTILPPAEVVNPNFGFENISVSASTSFNIKVYAYSNVNWSAIDWKPIVEYTAFDNGDPVLDSNGNALIALYPHIDFETYAHVERFGEMYIADSDGELNITGNYLDNNLFTNAIVTIKSKKQKDSLHFQTAIFPNVQIDHVINVVEGDTVFVDIHNTYMRSILNAPMFAVSYRLNGDRQFLDGGIYSKREKTNYRGWGQFSYNANANRGDLALDFSALQVDTTGLASDTLLIDEGTEVDQVENGTSTSIDELFIVMRSDPQSMAWQGSDPLTFLDRYCMSSSRSGRQDVDLSSQPSIGVGNISTIDLVTKFKSDAIAGGVSGSGAASSVGLGGGATWAQTWSVWDVTDMNGDRIPDYLSENSIKYIRLRGSRSEINLTHNLGTHHAGSFGGGGGIGGSFVGSGAKNSSGSIGRGSVKKANGIRAKIKSKVNAARHAFKTSRGSGGLSVTLAADRDSTEHTFIDINGDGLEDKLWFDGRVALSKGYKFESPRSWSFEGIRAGDSFDVGGGPLGGFNQVNGSIAGGLSGSRTTSSSSLGFTDLNDDALLDLIVSVDPLVVRFNTGSGFGPEQTVTSIGDMDRGIAIGESINVAGTVCVPFLFVRVCFNASTYGGQGTSSTGTAFNDIDGDGYLDYLIAGVDDSELNVRSSRVGNTNMLRTIYTPTGGEISLDYKSVGNSYDMPFSKWVMSELTVYDGVSGDGIDTYVTSFDYDNPKYDRHERQLYGFGEVIENELDENMVVQRSIVTHYNVDNYYEKGLRTKIEIMDGDQNVYHATDFEYSLKDINTGADLPPSSRTRNDISAFPALTRKIISIKEGLDNVDIRRIYSYQYDTLGNVVVETDFDEAGSEIKIEREYKYDIENYHVDKVVKEKIFGDGQLFRETLFDRDDFGNIVKLVEKIDDNSTAISDMTFDEYGNIVSLSNPENYKGERMTYEYAYDSLQHQYVIYELDGYGHEKFYEYEYNHNQIIYSTDINGNETIYNLDAKGRTESILYPYEVEQELPYSIKFEYHPNAPIAYAVTHHYDPSHDDDLDVYNFEDGIFRQIQTKVQADLFDENPGQISFIVSGTESFDALGRKVTTYLPEIDKSLNPSIYFPDTDLVRATLAQYDVLDRPVQVVDTYDGTTQYEYSISSTNTGKNSLTTFKRDALNNTSNEFFNARGNILAERFDGPNGDIWRNYKYDGYAQVQNIIDHFGNETEYTYDLLGRRISVKVPDAGTTNLKYDNAGNLIERITATIRDVVSTDGAIKYSYDKERLIQIDYPKYFQNKVQIHYGSPQDSFNRVGRIWLQEDGSGGREYFFDANGYPTKTIRTVMINRSNVFTYVTESEYDTWGRIREMKYPDGEAVSYNYNKGGQLLSMTGTKNSRTVTYLKQLGYDKFGDRIHLEYGNGTVDKYSYDRKGRLEERFTRASSGTVSSEIYSYDLMDNLISKTNSSSASNELGGSHNEVFSYDKLYRMSGAEGTWNGAESNEVYNIFLDYDDLNNLTMKGQSHEANGVPQIFTNRTIDYQYELEAQPTRPSEVGGKEISYDKNGNLLLSTSNAVFDFDQNVFDEENRLIGTSNNGTINRFTYDAFGKRALKSSGESQGVFINGSPAGFVEHKVDFQAYVSPYFTAFENAYRKHYFIDDMRFLTKIGTGLFQTTLSQGPEITSGNIDYKSRIRQYEESILEYYVDSGAAPGPPSLLAINAQPEINTNSLPDASASGEYNLPPANWPDLPPPDTMGPPGVPVFFDIANFTNATVAAGYNFTSGDITNELVQFYYHYDNNESTHFVTDYAGEPRQYNLYFPTGETWISKSIGIDSTPYKYMGLELDDDSGYYNMGNIYYNPETNIELSIDPILQNFGQNTFLKRPEGDFYYDYADDGLDEEDPGFDNEILNSEKPDPFVKDAMNGFEPLNGFVSSEPDLLLRYRDIQNSLGGKEKEWDIDISINDVNPDQLFVKEISQLVPHLNERNIANKKELKALAKRVFKNHKWEAFKKRVKNLFKRKQKETKPVRTPTKRKVRIK